MTAPRRLRHLPALDGLRGLAVIAVLFFHGGFRWARGGWLGVSVFFTLSGFLITNLLVGEWSKEGTISLRTFWARRFRRLMPAALACLLLIALYGWVWASPEQLVHLRGDLLAGLGYVANWRFLFTKLSYADLFSAPSPVQHFWSLAIEEQFYVVYPLVAFAALRLGGRRLFTWLLAGAAVASLVVAFVERSHLDRVYYGTDTRMAELLAGALFAMWWSGAERRQDAPAPGWRASSVLLLGSAGLIGSLALWPSVGQAADFVTHGVLPLQACLSVAMLAAIARPTLLAKLLAWQPLRAVGLVSYGLYLYHWPIFLILSPDRTGLSQWPLFVVRVAATSAATIVSYYYLEQPIRHRRVFLSARVVRSAVLGGVSTVVAATLAVTWSPPASLIAHANVRLQDQKITIDTAPPSRTSSTIAGAPSGIMIVGDSGTYDAAPAIAAQYKALGTTTVVDASFPGFGFSRNPAGWEKDYPNLVAQQNPRLVIVMLGGWDEPYLKDKGRAAYDAMLDTAVRVLSAGGAKILWLGMLPGPKTETATMDAIFKDLAARHTGVVSYGEIGQAVRAPDGTYPRWIPDDQGTLILARKPDGWHLCPDGALRVAKDVADLSAAAGWSPRSSTGWEQGDWRASPRYDDPKGGCDPNRPSNRPG